MAITTTLSDGELQQRVRVELEPVLGVEVP
jgi:hypothetical protein